MDRLPNLSPGIIVAHNRRGAVLYDLIAEELCFLNFTAAALCSACAEGMSLTHATDLWADQTSTVARTIRSDVLAALEEFAARGWVGRAGMPVMHRPDAPVTALSAGEASTTRGAGAHNIRFRSQDRSLLAEIVDILALPAIDGAPSADFRLIRHQGGAVDLYTDSKWAFPNSEEPRERIVAIVNDFVARTTTDVVLHAAAARSPSGQVVVLPAPAGSGKSTLVAGLAQRGWCYFTDESVTVCTSDLSVLPYPKALDLDPSSRSALNLHPANGAMTPAVELGRSVCVATRPGPPPSAIVLCSFVGEAGRPAVTTLDPDVALTDLVRNTLNLRYVGSPGLDTLVRLAEGVPVHRVSYRSSAEAFDQLRDLELS